MRLRRSNSARGHD